MKIRNTSTTAMRIRAIQCCILAVAFASSATVFAGEHGPMMQGSAKGHMPMEPDNAPPMAGREMGRMGMPSPGESHSMAASGHADRDAAALPVEFPAFPGTPGIYHMGATDFFLDHPEHVTLTAAQQRSLEKIKTEAQAEQRRYRAQVEGIENELWSLTGSDSPDAVAIDRTTREIEALRRERRVSYIHAVGAAAEVLTEDQREQLVGALPPIAAPAKPLQKSK